MRSLRLGIITVLLTCGFAFAAGTPAGTQIQNQVSATYLDSSGQRQTTNSNLVTTIVNQVRSFTITPNGATEATPGQIRHGLPGSTVTFGYTVTNSGNGTDTVRLTTANGALPNLTDIRIYRDINCNGINDPGEPQITSLVLAADAVGCVVVTGVIPQAATDGAEHNIQLIGFSHGPNNDLAAVAETGPANWARAVATTTANFSIIKGASPTGSITVGQTLTYTISGSNSGGNAAAASLNVVMVDGTNRTAIFLSDVIPAGTSFAGNLTASFGAGAPPLLVYQNRANGNWQTTVPADVQAVGVLVTHPTDATSTDPFFPQNANYTMSFQVTVNTNLPAGALVENSAVINFNNTTRTSNTTTNTVAPSHSGRIGPFADPEAAAGRLANITDPYDYRDPVTNINWTIARNTPEADTQVIASAGIGQTVSFRNTIRNTGNAQNTLNVNVTSFPAGWAVGIFNADGTTPLSAGLLLASGASADIIVKAVIPANATVGVANYDIVLNISSSNGVTDSTLNRVAALTSGYRLDLRHQNPSNPAGDFDHQNRTGTAGSVVNFPIEVRNIGDNNDTYDLSATFPPFWTVAFYARDCAQAAPTPPAIPTGTPVDNTGVVTAGGSRCFTAVVTIPANALADSDGDPAGQTPYGLSFTATSNNLSTVTDTITANVTVDVNAAFTFSPDRTGTVSSPGTITYTHTITNTGNSSLSVAIAAPTGLFNWVYQLSADNITFTNTTLTVSGIAPGASRVIYVRVQVPSGQPNNRVDTAIVTATGTFAFSAAAPTRSVTDRTTVIAGELSIIKSWTLNGTDYFRGDGTDLVTPPGVDPAQNITYRFVAQNIGTGSLAHVVLTDPVPAHTTFVGFGAAPLSGYPAGSEVLVSKDGITWVALATGLSAPVSHVYVGVDTNNDGTITPADVMPASASITFHFTVQVNP